MTGDDLKAKTASLMPQLRTDLEKLVRLPSVAFEGFPEEPVKQTGAAVAELLTAAGLPGVRMVDIARAPQATATLAMPSWSVDTKVSDISTEVVA